MKTTIGTLLLILVAIGLSGQRAQGAPDLYVGDTAIYGGAQAAVQPNVLFILDTSGSMDEEVPGDPYVASTTYPVTNGCDGAACVANKVYVCTDSGSKCDEWSSHVTNVSSVTTSCGSSNPKQSLQTTGQWNSSNRRIRTTGACQNSGSGLYALGNWVNWSEGVGAPEAKMEIAKRVVQNVVSSTFGVRFGLFIFNDKQGAKRFTQSGYTADVKDMDAIYSGVQTNRQKLVSTVSSITADSFTPLAESLFEGMRYYSGGQTAFNGSFTYTSPIQADCQKNYIVLITDGMSTEDRDNVLKTICTNGDCNNDGHEPANDPAKTYSNNGSDYLDDVAKYLHDSDLSTTFAGTQNVITYTVGFGLGASNAGAVKLLSETAQNGGGQAFLSEDEQGLIQAVTQILGGIFETNSSFVAPVVPVSPENRTYSGSRIYLGFFKPLSGAAFWLGNLKKYAIDLNGTVVDYNGDIANYLDNDGNGVDDRSGNTLPTGASNGSFLDSTVSFWTNPGTPDGGDVDSGGAGELLRDRDLSTNPRKIYTYLGVANLTNATNAFATTNAALTFGALGVADNTEKDRLINFIHGIDTYDEDVDGSTTEKREWVLGDILHAKPLVVNYESYSFTTTNESDCSVNKTRIYVGANDGMLHAFKDCDGSEAWAFIPQDLLPNLQYLSNTAHTAFVDGSPVVYTYDANKDGNLRTVDGDKVVLLIGQRRGGGFYYALDITNSDAPTYLWRLSSTVSPSGVNTDYSELGESWSDPELVKVLIGLQTKVVMIIGAGYDHRNEDGRYGATQTFTGTGTTSGAGEGNVTSGGVSAPLTPKGRGLYVVEIATLLPDGFGVPSIPSFATSGWKVWGYTNANNAAMAFSMASGATIVDANYNNYADRVYIGDTGGNMWRFDIGSSATASWAVRKVFAANPGSAGASDVGRKIFYKPSVVFESGYTVVSFGTGDREHPLNTAIVDRLYAVKDKDSDQTTIATEVANLVDVTADLLQASSDPAVIAGILASLNSQYGWYIKLEHTGEKVLAPALTFFNTFYTTYSPEVVVTPDPCAAGNLGTARIYVVSYKTGEAAVNFDQTNDSTTTTNTRALNDDNKVLLKSDRLQTIGQGIPSGVVVVLTAAGEVPAFIGCGGGLCEAPPPEGGNTIPLYWRRVL